MIRKILLLLLAVLVLIQFIRPAKNLSVTMSGNDITTHMVIPGDVLDIFKKSCYDCHSNNTIYPWYFHIQPVAWWMQDHVNEGRKELNFSEFASYSPKKQYHKMRGIAEQIRNGEMPLDSYLWIHKDAILSDAQKTKILAWADSSGASIKRQYNIPDDPERNIKRN